MGSGGQFPRRKGWRLDGYGDYGAWEAEAGGNLVYLVGQIATLDDGVENRRRRLAPQLTHR